MWILPREAEQAAQTLVLGTEKQKEISRRRMGSGSGPGKINLGKEEGKMKSRIEKRKLHIELPLGRPRPSQSGKTLVVASSRGPRRVKGQLNGKTVFAVASAFIHREDDEDGPRAVKQRVEGAKRNPGKTMQNRAKPYKEGRQRERKQARSIQLPRFSR